MYVLFFFRLQIRPYGVLFALALGFWLYKLFTPDLKIVPPPTLCTKFENTYRKLLQLRQDKPPLFCIVLSAGLVALALIGHIVSGSSIVVFGLLLAAIIFSRHKITIVKDTKNKGKYSF